MGYTHVHCTFRFQSNQGDTCSESFYRAASGLGTIDPDSGPVVAVKQWIAKRVFPLVKTWRIRSFKISPAPLPGGGESAPRLSLNIPVGPEGVGKADRLQDVPATVKLITLRTTNAHVRQYAIHGVSDSSIQYTTEGVPVLGTNSELQTFLDYLVNDNGWQLRITKIGATDNANKRIKSIAVAAGVTTFTIPDLVIPAGVRKINVATAKGYKAGQFDGEWLIESFDPITFVLTTTTRRRIDPEFFYVRNSATVRLINDGLIGFDDLKTYDANVARPATHKVGNPIEGRAGRRSVLR